MAQYKIAVCGSRRQDPYLKELDALFAYLERCGIRVLLHSAFARYLDEIRVDTYGGVPVDKLPDDVSLVMSIGGDGTFLRTFRWIGRKEVPILGVNTGHLGYLASCHIGNVLEMLEKVFRGDISIEKRMALAVSGDDLSADLWPYALNEVAMLRDERASIITVHAAIDGGRLAEYRADGLIVATPTGSTAYNLSAGGPILQPTLDCMVLSPIAPHTLTLRPLVVGADGALQLVAESRSANFRLNLDDRTYTLPSGKKITVKKADFYALLIREKGSDFASVLRDRLLWNAQG